MGEAIHREKSVNRNRDYSVGHYYLVPNAVFTLGLSPGELAVYNSLLFREDRKTFECVASYGKIAADVNCSKNSVKKYVRGLEEKGLISTEQTAVHRRSDGKKRNGCLRYRIHHIDHALEQYYEQQLAKLRAG